MYEQKIIKNKPINDNENDGFLLSSQIGGWVYILKSKKDKNLYIGSTNNLRERFKKHNEGLVRSTKSRRPFELIYYEAYKVEKDARKREMNLKLRSRAFAQLKKRIQESLK
jgi:putative endonuclease